MKEIKSILLALNSTGPCMFKYPIGNQELTAKVKELEQQGKIKFNSLYSKWVKS